MKNVLANIIILVSLIFMISLTISDAEEQREDKTNLIINNEVYGSSLEPELIYSIKTPKIIDYDFILAIDSSGSIEDEKYQKDAITNAVPDFINDISKNYPDANFNISIVSWDDNIDFSYDSEENFNENDTSNVKLADLNTSRNDIVNNFINNYYGKETEGTDISIPIKASLEILGSAANRPNDYHKNKRFVIVVSGNGEFKPATDELINEAEGKYEFYVIGMDVALKSELRDHLKKIAEYDNKRYIFLPAGDLYPPLNETLKSALLSHLENATKSPVARNVKIKESLYCYYSLDPNSVKINGEPVETSSINIWPPNEDGTQTFELEVPEGLLPNSETKVTLDVNFNPGYLPVTVTSDKKPISLCSPKSDTPIGEFSFDWFNKEHFKLNLKGAERGTGISPSSKLKIMSSNQEIDTKENMSVIKKIINSLSLFRILENSK